MERRSFSTSSSYWRPAHSRPSLASRLMHPAKSAAQKWEDLFQRGVNDRDRACARRYSEDKVKLPNPVKVKHLSLP